MYFLEKAFFETAVKTVKTIFCKSSSSIPMHNSMWIMIYLSNVTLIHDLAEQWTSKGKSQYDDSMMTVWVRKGLNKLFHQTVLHYLKCQ